MEQWIILTVLLGYFGLLFLISFFTGKGASNDDFYLGSRKSHWFLVAFGMIGASLSGVTFISVPGKVSTDQFGYMQIVLGYFVGYLVVALVLLPLYYKRNLTSIYTYLNERFGMEAYRLGAIFFLVSRTIGAAIRLLLVAGVLQYLIFDEWDVPFVLTATLSILFIWLYTYKGGIKTIVWTDTLQTGFMLLSLFITLIVLYQGIAREEGEVLTQLHNAQLDRVFHFGSIFQGGHFLKSFIGGMFITIGMTGLDQDMMQKNLSCRNITDAKKNMITMASLLVVINLLFLVLGGLMHVYAGQQGIDIPTVDGSPRTDLLFPHIAMDQGMGMGLSLLFLLGLVAAAYSSADSALTALTTSVCIDLIGIDKKEAQKQSALRKKVHVLVSVVLLIVILVLEATTELSAIGRIIFFAGFTYGPLIGLFFFGILSTRSIKPLHILWISLIVPILLGVYHFLEEGMIGPYQIGAELIAINAILVFSLLFLFSSSSKTSKV